MLCIRRAYDASHWSRLRSAAPARHADPHDAVAGSMIGHDPLGSQIGLIEGDPGEVGGNQELLQRS
jgi:hypothetical protein